MPPAIFDVTLEAPAVERVVHTVTSTMTTDTTETAVGSEGVDMKPLPANPNTTDARASANGAVE